MIKDAILFILTVLLNLYISLLILRCLLHWGGANFYHPFCQFLSKITHPLLVPFHYLKTQWQKTPWILLFLAWVLDVIKLLVLFFFSSPVFPSLGKLFFMAGGDILIHIINIYFYGTLLYILVSWIPLPPLLSLRELSGSLIMPLLNPLRRYIPPMGGIDICPLILMIGLQLSRTILLTPLMGIIN